jgi:hypothetical protein
VAKGLSLRGSIHGPDENARRVVAAQAQPATGELQQARTSGANDLKLAAVANADLRHAANPMRLALDIFHDGTSAGVEKVEWEEAGGHDRQPVKSHIPY